MMANLAFCVLGPMQITCDGAAVTGLESTKAQALLVYLAVEGSHPHRRATLAALLWPGESEAVSQHNLRQALANLRQALGDRTAAPPFLLITRTTIQFNLASTSWLDVDACTALLAACETHPHRRATTCASCAARRAQAVALYRGDFLEHFFVSDSAAFEEWASFKRERVRQQALAALAHQTTYHEQRGAYEEAQHTAWRQVELDPWNEEAHRQLMHVLWLSGQRAIALAHYERLRHMIRHELGMDPAPETTTLSAQIRDAKPDATARNEDAGRLQVPATPFIGREEDLARLADLLQHPGCQLITLTGPGGIGKTRLALQAAADQGATFADGVAFVALAALTTADLLVPTIASALTLMLDSHVDPTTQLLRYLRDKDLLLVLDNVEHLLGGTSSRPGVAAGLLAEIIRQAPHVTLLVTSRERLQLQGEWVFDVAGLPYPADTQCDGIAGSSAVQLFLQGARRAHAGFALTADEAPWVARICRLVEGMPLGLELAAAWVRVLTCQEIARELEGSLDVLAGSLRDVPARHQSLRAVLNHSWDLLTAEEQRVLWQLAVFRGGIEREAAEQVAGASLTLLAALVDKSLLHLSVNNGATRRFELHELVRQYAGEHLAAAEEAETLRRRHAEYYLALAEVAEPELWANKQAVVWLDRLAVDHDNFRVALAWSQTAPSGRDIGLRIAGALRNYWLHRGHINEGRTWLEGLLTQGAIEGIPASYPSTVEPAELRSRATALRAAGYLAENVGALMQAQALLEESVGLFRKLERKEDTALTVWSLAHCARQQGQWTRATRIGEESLELFREVGSTTGIGWCLWLLGDVARELGDVARAKALAEQAVTLARERENQVLIGYALFGLSRATLAQGDLARARALAEEALTIGRDLGHRTFNAQVMLELGRVATAEGDEAQSAVVWKQALALARVTQHQRATAEILLELGRLAHRQGDDRRAQALLGESLHLYWERKHRGLIAECLACLAGVAATGYPPCVPSPSGDSRAARLFGAADALYTANGGQGQPPVRADTERDLAAARAQLDEEGFAAAWAEGQAMPLEQAVAYALDHQFLMSAPASRLPLQLTPALTIPRSVPEGLASLTFRQWEVLRLVAQGWRTAEVADALGLSPLTVNVHLRGIYRKLGVRSRTAATRVALQHHLG